MSYKTKSVVLLQAQDWLGVEYDVGSVVRDVPVKMALHWESLRIARDATPEELLPVKRVRKLSDETDNTLHEGEFGSTLEWEPHPGEKETNEDDSLDDATSGDASTSDT